MSFFGLHFQLNSLTLNISNMAKKSLSEQISSLYTPKTDYDIEDHDLDVSKDNGIFQHHDGGSENESEDEDTGLRNEHYVESSKSKLRQQNEGVNLGEKYVGNVTSRSKLYDDEDDKQPTEASSGEELDAESAEEEEDEESEDVADDDEDDQESDRSSSSDAENDEDENISHKRELLKQLMSKERSHIVNRLSQSATNDALKGYSIQQQNKTFEKIIDVRLKFQKSVTSSNMLPINTSTYSETKSEDSDELVTKAKKQFYSLLDHLFTLRNELDESTSVKTPKKRSFAKYSEVTSAADAQLNSRRNQILTKWSAKVANSSGRNAMNANKFKTINQSFEQQVNNNLSDMDRLIKRTKLNRRNVTPIGYTTKEEDDHENGNKNKSIDEDDDDIPEDTSVRKKTQGLENDYIFDDEDFYRVLLNDLVDKKVQTSDPTSGITISLRAAQKSNKLKNNVDTKASKGRKLRYHVQEPIANFETSRGSWRWNDDQIDEFFASLLGQKVNMNEIDDEQEEEQENDDNDIIPEDNGIQLFG